MQWKQEEWGCRSALPGPGRSDPRGSIGTSEHFGINLPQFSQRHFDVAPLTLQHIDLLHAFPAADRQGVGATTCARGKHFADFGQGEPEPFTLQNEGQPVAVSVAKDTGAAVAVGGKQTFALVKSQCPQSHARFARKLADGNIARSEWLRTHPAALAGPIDTAVGMSAVFVFHVTPTYYLPDSRQP